MNAGFDPGDAPGPAAAWTAPKGLNVRVSSRHLAESQHYIEEGIASKGKVLTQNHALALRTMTLDNAFVDMQRLVDHTVQQDADLVYGIYIGSERVALAYSRHGEQLSSRSQATRLATG